MKDIKGEARKKVLLDLKKKMSGSQAEYLKKGMSESMPPVKKVSVMADSEEGLEEGLEKAKEIVSKKDGMMDMVKKALGDKADMMEESEEESEEEGQEEMDLESVDSLEEIEALMKALEEKKKALMMK